MNKRERQRRSVTAARRPQSATPPAPGSVIVRMEGISKSFGAVAANIGATLELAPGSIHALVGENGAGKTTLMNVLAGSVVPDRGSVHVFDRNVTGWNSAQAIAAGVGMVHQHSMLIPSLTVTENIIAGREPVRGRVLDYETARKEVRELSSSTGLVVQPDAIASTLGIGEAQHVAILRTLYRGARVLILDEPTTVLTPAEVNDLWRVLRTLRDQENSIVLITHRLEEVFGIADTVTVMRRGSTTGHFAITETDPQEIVRCMLGDGATDKSHDSTPDDASPPLGERATHEKKADGEPQSPGYGGSVAMALRVEDLTVLDDAGEVAVRELSFGIAAGEILGVAGVDGNGQQELVEALVGGRKAEGGRIALREYNLAGLPVHARAAIGVAYIPADRAQRGLIQEYPVSDNLILGQQRLYRKRGLLDRARISGNADALIRKFDIRPSAQSVEARTLSGGNQQKVIVAREMTRDFHLLIASHPTRGADIGTTRLIHSLLRAARNEGKSILLVGSDLEEILRLSDRIAVMYRGEFVTVRAAAGCDLNTLGRYMTGVAV